ncbi:MAG: M24 family metallopeptidase [Bdellovibrionales bacterium]
MIGPVIETVGEHFQDALIETAREKTLQVIRTAAKLVKPGMTELETKTMVAKIQTEMGAPTSWHPPQIRFGENTILPFAMKGVENPTLKENDIFFFDIGPIWDGHEGDVGRPFTVGHDPEMKKCCEDAEKLWHEVRDKWKSTGATGSELYKFANERAIALGWRLSLQKANGHRIADFPHAARGRGSIENYEKNPQANRWILEIQIRHPEKPFGAFYEDLLN